MFILTFHYSYQSYDVKIILVADLMVDKNTINWNLLNRLCYRFLKYNTNCAITFDAQNESIKMESAN